MRQIGVEKGVCVEARSRETPGWIAGIVTKVFDDGQVKVATPGKTYFLDSRDCLIRRDVPKKLEKFFERKRKELGLTNKPK